MALILVRSALGVSSPLDFSFPQVGKFSFLLHTLLFLCLLCHFCHKKEIYWGLNQMKFFLSLQS